MSVKNFLSFKDVAVKTIKERRVRDISNICRYGINILDSYLGGIIENELVVIGAGSGIGKTELAGKIAINNAMRGKKVALLSLEGDIGEIIYRYFQREINKGKTSGYIKGPEYRLNLKDVKREEDLVMDNIPKEMDNLMIFNKSFIPDRKKLLELLRDMYQEVDLFVIDHLHYLDYGSDERNGITEIVKGIKEMTEIMKVPVVLISHLRRDFDKKGKLPTKSDLHGSSNIEKNANTVILLAPDDNAQEMINADNPGQGAFLRGTKIIVDKNRTGMPVPAIFNTTFDLRTKEYIKGDKNEYITPDEKNKITIHDKIF